MRRASEWPRPAEETPRSGVTLLELILALALTALVMVLISQAIRLHLTVFDVGRHEVEQPQVARAVLRYIAADLRNAVRPIPAKASQGGASTAAAAGGSSAAGSSATGASGKASSGSLGTQKSTSTTGANTNTNASSGASTTSSAMSTGAPVFLGSQYELQIDVSRPPRVDQYTPSSAPSGTGAPVDIASDVKTVSYSLQTGEAAGTAGGASPTGATGLVRREQDRAVSSYMSKSSGGSTDGSGDSAANGGQLLAPEVNRLEFRYFDGTTWVTEWDSQQLGGLPLAVEIMLGIDPTVGQNTEAGAATALPTMTSAATDEFTYRLVVRVPVAEPIMTTGAATSDPSQGALEP